MIVLSLVCCIRVESSGKFETGMVEDENLKIT